MDVDVATTFSHLDRQLQQFVLRHAGMRQRDSSWYTAMGTTVGGSEVAALMGCNPYSNVHDVVASKVALLQGRDTWTGGGAACWWGVIFEDIAAEYTAIELGSAVRGDDICVQRYPGHRNSPDGYIVACSVLVPEPAPELALEPEPDESNLDSSSESSSVEPCDRSFRLWTTDMDRALATLPRIFLLEFKCPISRCPGGDVPPQYRPQIWSGLAVSPVAHAGLFIDCVFRKCAIGALGPGPAYDTDYHTQKAKGVVYTAAVAWGLIGIYAPALDAPRGVRLNWRRSTWSEGDPTDDVDYAAEAWRLRTEANAAGYCVEDVIDLGAAPGRTFDRVLNTVNLRRFSCRRLTPCFADGRGLDLQTEAAIAAEIDLLRATAPMHHCLLGVVPWKLFEVTMVPVSRHPDFMGMVGPLIDDVHERVRVALAQPDPDQFLRNARRASAKPKKSISDADAFSQMYDSPVLPE
jgi:hypothetical protein